MKNRNKNKISIVTLLVICTSFASSAQVGIETTSPVHDLQIRNVVGIGGGTSDRYAQIYMNSNYSGGKQLKIWTDGLLNELYFSALDNTTDLSEGANAQIPLRFSLLAPSNSLRMNSVGAIAMGATPNGAYKLLVNGDFRANGDVYSNSTVLTSDARLKSDVSDVSEALALIQLLRPVHYTKGAPFTDAPSRQEFGFIAQEVREILPELVFGEETDSTYLSLDYNSFISILTSATQEQQSKIEELEKVVLELQKANVSNSDTAMASIGGWGSVVLLCGLVFMIGNRISSRKNQPKTQV